MAQSTVRSNTDASSRIHPEHEAAVDHHAEIVQPADRRAVVASQVLILALLGEVVDVQRFEADEQAAQPGVHRSLEKPRQQNRIDRAGRLPETAHAAHAVEQCRGKAPVAEQMIVEKVEMPARQPLDLARAQSSTVWV